MKGGRGVAEKETTSNALKIVENLEPATVAQVMQRIVNFQNVIQKTLKEGHDYGVIPGTGNKPTLLKPGAEKILMLMGVTSEYEIIERVQDYDKGFFAFTVKCVLSRGGQVITEGVGHANTRERRYTRVKEGREPQDPYTLANTVLKMAKKRAQVDATLTIAALSEIFTQDIEDMDIAENTYNPNVDNPGDIVVTFGKHKGKRLADIPIDYVEWLAKNARDDWMRKAAISVVNGNVDKNKPEPVPEPAEDNFPGDDELAEMEMFEE
jgi:hypothetical protein